MKLFLSLFVLLYLFTSTSANSHSPETIASDRPGNAYTSTVVGNGIFQFQNGFDLNTGKFDNNIPEPTKYTNTTVFQSNLIRYGIGVKNEINAAIDYTRFESDYSVFGDPITGFSKLGLAYRRNFSEKLFNNSSIGMLAQVNFNDLLDDFKYSNPDAFVLIITQTPISETFGLTTNFGFDFSDQQGQSGLTSNFLYTINLGFGIKGNLSGYIETYGAYSNGNNNLYFDGGIAYLISPNVQLDLYSGFSSDQNYFEYFVSTGISWRMGNL